MSTILEILSDANKNIKTIVAYKNNAYLRKFMEAAFVPEKKVLLPEGRPPFEPLKDSAHQNPGALWQIAKKLDVLYRTDVKPIIREVAFIRALESVSEVEADLLMMMKDQTVELIYPELTYEKLKDVGYF